MNTDDELKVSFHSKTIACQFQDFPVSLLLVFEDCIHHLTQGEISIADARLELMQKNRDEYESFAKSHLFKFRTGDICGVWSTILSTAQSLCYLHRNEIKTSNNDYFPAKELIAFERPELIESTWAAAGGVFYNGRAIAKVTDPIWTKPLSEGGFSSFGLPYPPYSFGCEFRTKTITYPDASRAGLDVPKPKSKLSKKELSVLKERLVSSGLAKYENDGTVTLTIEKTNNSE